MTVEYEDYHLVEGKISLKDGKTYSRYFFAKRDIKDGETLVDKLPAGYEIVPPKRTGGFPFLKKTK